MQDGDGTGAPPGLAIAPGFSEAERETVARLFWEAFSGKLGRLMRPEPKALAFLCRALRSDFARVARDGEGRLLGVAGIKTPRGGLVAGGLRELAAAYGWPGALWRGPLLELTERPLAPNQMLLDGLFVAPAARGRGVGTALVGAVIAEAEGLGLREVRLDVVDSNPRARALYARLGFVPAGEDRLGPLRLVFGFRRSIRMIRPLHPGPPR